MFMTENNKPAAEQTYLRDFTTEILISALEGIKMRIPELEKLPLASRELFNKHAFEFITEAQHRLYLAEKSR